jgi:hypothetical protein
MNEMYFQGRISTFSYTYNTDGSVSLSIEAIGTSNTYLDVSLYMGAKKKTSETSESTVNQVENIYTALSTEVDSITKIYNEKQIFEFEHLIANKTDQGILVGTPYIVGNTNAPKTERMITLAYLIEYINTKIYEQIDNTIKINCDDTVCFSNYYEKLVSADPCNILLWQGKSSIQTSTYDIKDDANGISEFKMFPKVTATSEGFSINDSTGGKSFPSRIYINLQLIKKIIDDVTKANDASIKQLLIALSNEIKINTNTSILSINNIYFYFTSSYCHIYFTYIICLSLKCLSAIFTPCSFIISLVVYINCGSPLLICLPTCPLFLLNGLGVK